MNTRINTFLYMMLAIVLLGSCKKDSLFKGTDNNITAFELNQGDVVLKGAISQNNIVITAPENMVLTGATPKVLLSEKASIQPDPASISNWDEAHEFVVTAHNGSQTTYSYKVERNIISREGDVVLLSQADVDALAALKLTAINGSLTIGKASGEDKITSLDALSGLKSIAYDLNINPTYTAKDLSGLKNLEQVGAIQIGALEKLETLELPKLKTVMLNLVVNGAGVKTIKLPELLKIDKGLQLISLLSLTEINFPKLKSIVQNISIQGSYAPSLLKSIAFPELENMEGDLIISQWTQLASIQFPKLKKVNELSVIGFAELKAFEAPQLKNILANLEISHNEKMSTLDLSGLQTVAGGFRLQNLPELKNLDGLKSLTSVQGDLFFYTMPGIKNMNGLKSLVSVGGNVMLSGFNVLEDPNLEALANLKKITGTLTISETPFKKFTGFGLTEISSLSIFGYNVSTIEEIDVTKLNILTNITLSNISTNVKLKGKDSYDCGLTFDQANVTLEGFKEVKDFTYNMSSADLKPVQTITVAKVKNNLTLGIYGFSKLSLPNLEEIGKASRITVSSKMELDLPALKKSGSLEIAATQMDVLNFPALQTIDGDCSINTANYQGSMGDLKLPALTSINGTLKLFGYSSYYTNTKMANLNGLSALSSVKRIEISYNVALNDFTGLKKAIASIAASNWVVSGNKYNPSYDDMVNAKYVK
ncbi:hypothetical protein [Pedobacter sp. MC2016-24]|uniref:hypothetical protein n=1 Tax=Pedobacter sp. MC2016-24 TaxID=2780090 RepID=UPI00187FEC3C|nr:hypothetical protein [Pedobacter sp. MC2016-24]MBE9600965.1 hypothetical protein [Pedobacter sp. MC2016-24]